MNIKKLLPFLFVAVFLLSLAGCVSSELDAQWRIQAYLERKYDGTFQIEGVQAKAKIPEKHQLDVNQLRSDLERIAAYAGEEHKINRVLQTFHAEHGYLYEISLSNEFFFVNSGDTYFGVRLTMPEVCPTERAEDVFQLCQALRTEGIDFGLRIYTADSQSSVFIQKEETEDIANIEETLRELEESPSTQE